VGLAQEPELRQVLMESAEFGLDQAPAPERAWVLDQSLVNSARLQLGQARAPDQVLVLGSLLDRGLV
jgi:hypothetical protein